MRLPRPFSITSFTILLVAGGVLPSVSQSATGGRRASHRRLTWPLGRKCDTVHVYIAPQDFDGFVSKFWKVVWSRGLKPPHPYGYMHLNMRVCQFRHDRKSTASIQLALPASSS